MPLWLTGNGDVGEFVSILGKIIENLGDSIQHLQPTLRKLIKELGSLDMESQVFIGRFVEKIIEDSVNYVGNVAQTVGPMVFKGQEWLRDTVDSLKSAQSKIDKVLAKLIDKFGHALGPVFIEGQKLTGDAFPEEFPEVITYSVITRDNAFISAHYVYTGLLVGEEKTFTSTTRIK